MQQEKFTFTKFLTPKEFHVLMQREDVQEAYTYFTANAVPKLDVDKGTQRYFIHNSIKYIEMESKDLINK